MTARNVGGRRGLVAVLALVAAFVVPPMGGPRAADDPRVALLEAVRLDDAATVARLLAEGVSPNLREKSEGPAIVMAARQKSYAALAPLARAAGVEIDATDPNGQTALMLAAIHGHVASVRLLLDAGAAIERPGWSPLHYAAVGGHPEVVDLLLARGARVDSRSDNGTTPLMMAARHKNFSVMEMLADAGADLRARNQAGMTVLSYLEAHAERERIAEMRERLARPAR